MARRQSGETSAAIRASLGPVTARVTALKAQRAEVIKELHDLIATARQMLADLGEDDGRGRGASRRRAGRARRRLSPEGRARIVAAVRKRWAKYRQQQQASASSQTSA